MRQAGAPGTPPPAASCQIVVLNFPSAALYSYEECEIALAPLVSRAGAWARSGHGIIKNDA